MPPGRPLLKVRATPRHALARPPPALAHVQFLINEEGALRSGLGELAFSATLTQLDGGWNLFHLGEAADYLLGPGACRRWQNGEPPAETDAFEDKLQVR